MEFRFYNELTHDEIMIRETVFVDEQGFQNEFDDIDKNCIHLVVYQDQKAIACARMYQANNKMHLGRIAVLKHYRKQQIGSQILKQLENKALSMNLKKIALSAQVRVSDFYKVNGYESMGDIYYDEYCPHIHMEKNLD